MIEYIRFNSEYPLYLPEYWEGKDYFQEGDNSYPYACLE